MGDIIESVKSAYAQDPVMVGAIGLAVVALVIGIFAKLVKLVIFAALLGAVGTGIWYANQQGWLNL